MARGLNVSCVMTCLLRKQAGQVTLNLYLAWTGQSTIYKETLINRSLIVKRPMLLKWKWTNIWYFLLGKSNLFVNNVERLLKQNNSSAACKNLFWGTLFICQYCEKSIIRSWVLRKQSQKVQTIIRICRS